MTVPPAEPTRAICVYEDRPYHFTGVKLSLLSLMNRFPGAVLYVGHRSLPENFRAWMADFPFIRELVFDGNEIGGFDVKPAALLRLLDLGHSEVFWFDSDILWMGAGTAGLDNLPRDILVATEETYWAQQQGSTKRTLHWGMKPGRALTATVNTGILRVTEDHRQLLEAWAELLHHPSYRQAQAKQAAERPMHMLGDQEVFTALLGSERFAGIPLKLLRRGLDIAQCFGPAGWTPFERLQCLLRGHPHFIHAMGVKPWTRVKAKYTFWSALRERNLRAYYDAVSMELSPYRVAAKKYSSQLREDISWLQPQTLPACISVFVFRDHFLAQGMPLAMFDSLTRRLRRWLGIARYREYDEYILQTSPLRP
ncbi:hypothetical protein [Neorhizobium sp. LjRoot104]|uniref:hypothetical protein n=1 Tax=Neorhizobium sp. LjRoot104 TaxID=3342254 RepID=UPI003ECFBBC2